MSLVFETYLHARAQLEKANDALLEVEEQCRHAESVFASKDKNLEELINSAISTFVKAVPEFVTRFELVRHNVAACKERNSVLARYKIDLDAKIKTKKNLIEKLYIDENALNAEAKNIRKSLEVENNKLQALQAKLNQSERYQKTLTSYIGNISDEGFFEEDFFHDSTIEDLDFNFEKEFKETEVRMMLSDYRRESELQEVYRKDISTQFEVCWELQKKLSEIPQKDVYRKVVIEQLKELQISYLAMEAEENSNSAKISEGEAVLSTVDQVVGGRVFETFINNEEDAISYFCEFLSEREGQTLRSVAMQYRASLARLETLEEELQNKLGQVQDLQNLLYSFKFDGFEKRYDEEITSRRVEQAMNMGMHI